MSNQQSESWPIQYSELLGIVPGEFNLSQRVIEPVLQIGRRDGTYEAILCGERKIRGKENIT